MQSLGRQDVAWAGSAGADALARVSSEVNAGLAGRLDAIFCAASYGGPGKRKLNLKRDDVDFPWQQRARLAAGEQKSCILLHNNYCTGLCTVMMRWNRVFRPMC